MSCVTLRPLPELARCPSLAARRQQVLIGGRALAVLGCTRRSINPDYLVRDQTTTAPVLTYAQGYYLNAHGHPFFAALWAAEQGRLLASTASLLALQAWHLAHAGAQQNEVAFGLTFLARLTPQTGLAGVSPFLSAAQLAAVQALLAAVPAQAKRWQVLRAAAEPGLVNTGTRPGRNSLLPLQWL